jgi:hypothetical protein
VANLPLAFAELLGGGVLLTAGISGNSVQDVFAGAISLKSFDAGAAGDGAATAGAATPQTSAGSPLPNANTGIPALDAIIRRANTIDSKHLSYQWGGGHTGGIVDAARATALDCSGAVSAALHINPRVASQFESWGEPGAGQRVTIWANAQHVLLEVDGHFWGTSSANPGGGAGWIPSSAISQEYLMKFTARHPKGL